MRVLRWIIGKKRRIFAVLVLVVIALCLIFWGPIRTNAKVALFVDQVFPQVPIKPLDWISYSPNHLRVRFASRYGPVDADLFLPRPLLGSASSHSESAIIIAQGVRANRSELKSFDNLGDTLGRLGYVVLFPRLTTVQNGSGGLEEPGMYVRAFQYLEGRHAVNPKRISFLGFSVGSSLALVAACDPQIRTRVHALIFFAGYYSLFDYLISVATRRDPFRGREIAWKPSTGASGAIGITKAVLRDKGAAGVLPIFQARGPRQAQRLLLASQPRELAGLKRFDPKSHIHVYTTPTFILDDPGDRFVPYVESEKLRSALSTKQVKAFLMSPEFQHVIPQHGGVLGFLGNLGALYNFLYRVLAYL